MSRRKQIAPCKVQESAVHQVQKLPQSSSDIKKFHLLPDSSLHNGHAKNGFEDSTSLVNCGSNSSHSSQEIDDSRKREVFKFQALYHHLENDFPHDLSVRKVLPQDASNNPDDQLSFSSDDQFKEPLNLSMSRYEEEDMEDCGERMANDVKTADDELTCPICHKTFMSRYGLLTHVEVHSTPELKCSSCNIRFSSRSSFVTHQISVHRGREDEPSNVTDPPTKHVFEKFKLFSGFNDLSFADFSCEKFPVISEDICSKNLHRLTKRDSKHFFLCKTCDRLFPTLASLQFHMEKVHRPASNEPPPTAPATSHTEGDECLPTPNEDSDPDKLAITNFLGLKAFPPPSVDQEASDAKRPGYSVDNSEVKTSPGLASLITPSWMKSKLSDQCFYDTEMSKDPTESRPPLKLKLVRRRATGEEGKPLLVPSQYFIEDETDIVEANWESHTGPDHDVTKKRNGKQVMCDTCGESFTNSTALSGHKAASICGIGIDSSGGGRKMYWCRLCNYASCEKSTILRHQRTHTGLRPYSCKICSIAFTTKANCERHIRKRHRMRIQNDSDVKNSVFCDYDLLRRARDGEINVPPTSSISNPGGKFFSFICRICKAAFSSRSNGARHVMAKHSIMNRKKANEAIICARLPVKRQDSGGLFKLKSKSAELTSNSEERTKNLNNIPSVAGRKVRLSLLKLSNHNSTFHKTNGDVRSLKVPKLIPLSKIRAHYVTTQRLVEKFDDEYEEVYQAICKMQEESPKITSKLLSLIGSARGMMKQNSSHHSSSLSSRDILTQSGDPSLYLSEEEYVDPHRDYEEENVGEFHGNIDYLKKSDEQFADGQHHFNDEEMDGNHSPNSSSLSSSPESPHHSMKTESSSLLLRHFAAQSNKSKLNNLDRLFQDGDNHGREKNKEDANDLSSVGELMNFLKNPSLMNMKNETNKSSTLVLPIDGNDEGGSPHKHDNGTCFGDVDNWNSIASSSKPRDEHGRYISDLGSPLSKQPNSKPPLSMVSYRNHSDLPTMVPIPGGKVSLSSLDLTTKRGESLNIHPSVKGRKCPKCNKIFPWASSLSRHIMTHTGLKPYMCAKCEMRFTTRSNLLRHAYRRHGLERGSNERHNVLLTLSLSDQKEYAEKEAQKMATMGQMEAQRMAEMGEAEDLSVDDQIDNFESLQNLDEDENNAEVTLPEVKEDVSNHPNKMYLCGLCKLPFANRSNLVRHLHRLHHITKDDPMFRSLLVKLQGTNSLKFKVNKSLFFPPIKPKSSSSPVVIVKSSSTPSTSPPAPVNGTESSQDVNSTSILKPFTCSICSIGFTKRNNAARHIQNQHGISRKSLNFQKLIIRNESALQEPGETTDPQRSFNTENKTLNNDSNLGNDDAGGLPKNDVTKEYTSTEPQLDVAHQPTDTEHPREDTPSGDTGQAGSSSWKSRRRSLTWKKLEEENNLQVDKEIAPLRHKKKDIRLTHFICGVCKRIFKEVEDLKVHLEDHNIPHPWYCTLCGVPFTNKYNCQRHLMRRHGRSDLEPKYVEDLRHGPRQPRKKSKGFSRGKSFKVKIAPKVDKVIKVENENIPVE